ncbi:MAG TPA: Plug domain-containing protein, partial [Chitinophagales bacterium]
MKLTLTLLTVCFCAFIFAQDTTIIITDSVNWNTISSNRNNYDNIPVISLSESELESDANTQNVSGILSSSRDVFQSAASYQLSQGGFRYRGYGSESTTLLINGVPMNNPDNGSLYWSEWGGLNDMFRSQQTTVGLASSTFSFGNLGGAMMFDSRAGHLFKGLNVGYAITNQRYRNRINASYASGFLKGNWAFAAAFSKRWAEHGYEPGTFYDGYSFFFSAEKLIRKKHSISFTVFGAPSKSARAAYSTNEFQTLANNAYYNPAWGLQNGVVRNANVSNTFEPIMLLSYEAKISAKTNLFSAISFQTGISRYSGFDWYNASSPYPDYYSKNPDLIEDSAQRAQAISTYENNPNLLQIQWDDIYNINRHSFDSVPNANG